MRLVAPAAALFVAVSTAAAADRSGAEIYKQLCAACHGAAGEGVREHYGKPLAGDRSVAELTTLIDKSMPEDAPEKCVGEDAKRVAQYIYDAFYSPIAQARIRPARIELSRLTVRQYRNTIADLIRGLRWNSAWDDRRGLRGEYYPSRNFSKGNLTFERLDPTVDFDFGEKSPNEEKIKPEQFAARWQGSLFAPESGEYEFILDSDNGAQLWVNDTKRPLIDAAVKSGKGAVRQSVRLVGGRAYALRLEFFKSEKAKEKTARIALKWRVPGREPEMIPTRYLSPVNVAETLVVATPFPPDDRSVGYERGTSVSKAWDQATTDAAIEVAGYVTANLAELSGVKNDAPDRAEKLREFGYKFVARAFRRPLSDEQKQLYVDRQFQRAADPEAAVKRVVLLALKSPRFLYHELEPGKPDAYDVASRLSYGLWDSLPDEPLLQAAAAGQLSTPEQVRKQAERMVGDLRTRGKLQPFFAVWLQLERFEDLSKDAKRFPDFDDALVSDLRTSLDLFLDDVVWSEASDFRQLLLADSLYLNGRLAKFYGANLPADAPFQKVRSLQPGERAGLLTHPYLMAGYAYTSSTSPIHRGVFVARSVLGRALRPPPEAVAPTPAELHPNLTTRQRIDLQTKAESCQSCHRMINPLGFAFEHFDAVGRYRTQEQGRPIDAGGTYLTLDGRTVKFSDVRDLAEFLARSDEAPEAFVEQLFHELVRQPVRAYGPTKLAELESWFAGHGFHIRNLMVEIAAAAALQPAGPPNESVSSSP